MVVFGEEECKRFLSTLANKLSEKNNDTYGTVITWLRTRLPMETTRASLLCLRGSRTPFSEAIKQMIYCSIILSAM